MGGKVRVDEPIRSSLFPIKSDPGLTAPGLSGSIPWHVARAVKRKSFRQVGSINKVRYNSAFPIPRI